MNIHYVLHASLALIEEMIANCLDDLLPSQYVQSAAELRKIDYTKINENPFLFLNKMEAMLAKDLQKPCSFIIKTEQNPNSCFI